MAKTTPKTGFPMFDGDQFIAVQQRNVDAMASAGQIFADGAKAIALRQSEMVQSAVEQWMGNSHKVFNAKPNEFKPADQVADARQAYENAVNNARELAEIAMKAQNEAFGVLTKAMMANLDDMKSLAKTA
jgi:phasin family protein